MTIPSHRLWFYLYCLWEIDMVLISKDSVQQVALRPLLDVYAMETGYEGGGRNQRLWCRHRTTEEKLWTMLEEEERGYDWDIGRGAEQKQWAGSKGKETKDHWETGDVQVYRWTQSGTEWGGAGNGKGRGIGSGVGGSGNWVGYTRNTGNKRRIGRVGRA